MAVPQFEIIDLAGDNAPWLVMVHGVSQDRRVFSAQVAHFRNDYRLLLIDLPGHGMSSDVSGPYELATFAAGIGAAVSRAGATRAHFWGTHIGAGAGLLLACERPDIFVSLILEGPVFPGRPLPTVSTVLARVAATARDDGMDAARELWWREGGWFDVMRQRPDECRAAEQRGIIDDFSGAPWLDAGLAPRAFDPIDAKLADLMTPVLIMNGEHDLPDFLDAAAALAEILPSVEQVTIRDGGGFPLWEFPDRVNAEVTRFLAGR